MRTIQKAGALALIMTAKCLREGLTVLADLRDAAERRQNSDDEIRALRAELESVNASLDEIKESLRPSEPWDNLTVQ